MTRGSSPWRGLGVSGRYLPEPPPIPVDRHRLQSLVRGELGPEERDEVFELIAAFRSWYDAYVDLVTEEGAVKLVEMPQNDDEAVRERGVRVLGQMDEAETGAAGMPTTEGEPKTAAETRASEVISEVTEGPGIAEGPEPTTGSTWPSIDIPFTGALLGTFHTSDRPGTVGDAERWTVEENDVTIEFSLRRGPTCTLEVRLFGQLNLGSSVQCDAVLYRGEETVARGEKKVGKLTFILPTSEVTGMTLKIDHRRGEQHTVLQVPVGK